MDREPTLKLEAVKYCELAKHTPVFYDEELDYYMWIYLDPTVVRNCYLYDVAEITTEDDIHTFQDVFQREGLCWLKVKTDYIQKGPGKHTYRFRFIDRETDVSFSLYSSYIVQTDNPAKPYIYMNREKSKGTI